MRKVTLALCAAAVLCLCGSQMAQARPEVPSGVLDFAGSKPEKMVKFNHATHKDSDCGVCHHVVNGAETYEKCATAGCHDDLTGKKSPALYAVVHSKKELKFQTCMSCHVAKAADDPAKKKELTGCKGSLCHAS